MSDIARQGLEKSVQDINENKRKYEEFKEKLVALQQPAPISFSFSYKIIAFLLICSCALSLSINSIYVNNFMTKKKIKFKDLLSDSENTLLYTTIGYCSFNILISIIILIINAKNKGRRKICSTYTENTKDEKGNDVEKIKKVTQKELTNNTNNINCNTLPVCKTLEDYNNYQKYKKQEDTENQYCIPKTYGTTILLICNILVSITGLITSVIMLINININGEKTYEENDSIFLYTMCLIFAVITGAIPLFIFTYAYATQKCINQPYIEAPEVKKTEIPTYTFSITPTTPTTSPATPT